MYQLSAFDVLYIFGCFLAMVTAGILFFWNHDKAPDVKWLALSYLAITLAFLVVFLLRSRLIIYVPHAYRTGFIFSFLYMPLSYLYLRGILTNKKPTKWDWLHALPVVIFIIDNNQFFFASSDLKVAKLKEDFLDPGYPFTLPHGMFLPTFLVQTLTFGVPSAYFFSQVLLVVKQSRKRPNFFKRENAELVRWILFYLSFQFLVFLMVFLYSLPDDHGYLFLVTHVMGVIMSLFIISTLFIHPDINKPIVARSAFPATVENAFGSTEESGVLKVAEEKNHSEGERLVKPLKNLTPKQISAMKNAMESFLRKEKPFLKHGYSLQEMANALSYQLYQLSALINREYGINFNDLINKYRIEYAVDIIKEGRFSNLNINGLADQCGFSNRNSFTKAFKKFVGLTPSEYFKESGN